MTFDNLIVELEIFIILSILAKLQEDQRSIDMLSMTYLNIKFL